MIVLKNRNDGAGRNGDSFQHVDLRFKRYSYRIADVSGNIEHHGLVTDSRKLKCYR